jgi:predicted SprT family Zn-dependent metalloprotease
MNKLQAHRLLREMMDNHGLLEVRAEMNPRLTTVFGRYRYSMLYGRSIELSSKLVEINDVERVTRAILHEIAHALTEGHGHDAVWKAKLLEIGGDGKTCYSSSDTNTIETTRSSKLYTLQCQDCFYRGGRYKRRMNNYRHRGCGGDMISVELT